MTNAQHSRMVKGLEFADIGYMLVSGELAIAGKAKDCSPTRMSAAYSSEAEDAESTGHRKRTRPLAMVACARPVMARPGNRAVVRVAELARRPASKTHRISGRKALSHDQAVWQTSTGSDLILGR